MIYDDIYWFEIVRYGSRFEPVLLLEMVRKAHPLVIQLVDYFTILNRIHIVWVTNGTVQDCIHIQLT